MPSVYNHWLVALSLTVAVLVSYTALRLAGRVATREGHGARIWLGIGAVVMGVGIWTMHFVGMLAFSLPVPIAYSVSTTFWSLAVAILTSGFALTMTSRRRKLPRASLMLSSVAMGVGIATMHYMGMGAITLFPGIAYNPALVALSFLIAISASFVALWLFVHFPEGDDSFGRRLSRMGAAVVMGLAISGMHYTAMAAAHFPLGAFCRGGITLQNSWLAAAIGMFALGLLAVTLVTAVYDAHLQSSARYQAERLKQANAELRHQATHDGLTQLPNRMLFLDRLEREIAHGDRDGRMFAVLVVDLDRFKAINDSLGHAAGDQVLVEIAHRLSAVVRSVDTVARTGGDEFLLLLTAIREPAAAAIIAANIVAALDKPVNISGTEVHASSSIGIGMYPADGNDADSLVAHADEAMYFTKQTGPQRLPVLQSQHECVLRRERLDFERDLRSALSLKQFEAYYQPKFDVITGRMNSVEALLRWRHPTPWTRQSSRIHPNCRGKRTHVRDRRMGCCARPVAKDVRGRAAGFP